MTHEPAGVFRPRLSHDGNFTIIPNTWIRNSALSAQANYLLIYLVSHEVGYEVKFDQITRETKLGVKAIRSAIAELKKQGWLDTERAVKPNGQLGPYRYVIREPATSPQGTVAQSTVAQATVAEGTHIKKTNKEEDKDRENKERELFADFYKTYPRKMQRGDALKAFSKALAIANFEDIIAGAIRFANDPNLPPDRFIPYPATWLRSEGWEDGPLPEDPRRRQEQEAKANELRMKEWLNEQD
jgi:hypothetical protein